MATNWPVSLQQKLDSESFEMRYGNTVTTTEMDVGMAKKRSRYTDGIDVYTCSILMDFDEQADLKTFFKTTLNNGALRFNFNDPFTGDPAEFRFVEPPAIRALGGRTFRVGMTWEKMP